jgi:hypothetical protein
MRRTKRKARIAESKAQLRWRTLYVEDRVRFVIWTLAKLGFVVGIWIAALSGHVAPWQW